MKAPGDFIPVAVKTFILMVGGRIPPPLPPLSACLRSRTEAVQLLQRLPFRIPSGHPLPIVMWPCRI